MLELVVQRLEGKQGVTKTQLENILDMFPHEKDELTLIPFAATGESVDGTQFSVFGFMRRSGADKMNEEMIDGFNAQLLREAEKKLPAGVHKSVSPYGIRTAIMG